MKPFGNGCSVQMSRRAALSAINSTVIGGVCGSAWANQGTAQVVYQTCAMTPIIQGADAAKFIQALRVPDSNKTKKLELLNEAFSDHLKGGVKSKAIESFHALSQTRALGGPGAGNDGANGYRAFIESSLSWKGKKTLNVFLRDQSSQTRLPDAGTRDLVVETIIEAVKKWEEWTGIPFVFNRESRVRPSSSNDIIVGFNYGGGHQSLLGRQSLNATSRGQNSMNLDPVDYINVLNDTGNRAQALRYMHRASTHEFGHALSMQHEHLNPSNGGLKWNRPVVIAYYQSTQGWSVDEIEHNVLQPLEITSFTKFSTFDAHSIMKYPIKKGHVAPGQESDFWDFDLSEKDKQWIRMVYRDIDPSVPLTGTFSPPNPVAQPTPPSDPGPSVQNVTSLTVGIPKEASLRNRGDIHWYKFDVDVAKAYSIETTDAQQTFVELTLYGPDDKNKLRAGPGRLDGARLFNANLRLGDSTPGLAKGTYYLKVQHRYAYWTGDYTLLVKSVDK